MLHRLAWLAAVVLFVLPGAAAAQVDNPYTVRGVEVDATDSSTAAARDRAFMEGQRLALERLVEQLTGPRSGINVAALSDVEVERMVQGFQVEQERTSPGRYRATLTYVFRPDAVRALVGDVAPPPGAPQGPLAVVPPGGEMAPGNVPGAGPGTAAAGEAVLVLPVLRTADAVRLWDSPNPWHDAWLNHGGDDAAPVLVPYGDVQDVIAIDARRALTGDRAALDAVAANYEAVGTLVALAEPSDAGLVVSTRLYGHRRLDGPASFTVPMSGGADTVYAEAVRRVVEQLAATTPAGEPAAAVPDGPRQQVVVLVPLASQRDWFQTRTRLGRVPAVVGTNVLSLSAQEVVLELDYQGSEADLRDALAREGLALERGPQALELRPAGR